MSGGVLILMLAAAFILGFVLGVAFILALLP
jgi:hypothetical protein